MAEVEGSSSSETQDTVVEASTSAKMPVSQLREPEPPHLAHAPATYRVTRQLALPGEFHEAAWE